MPTVETVSHKVVMGRLGHTTVYAVHHTVEHVSRAVNAGRHVLLFIDEIIGQSMRQQNYELILNREINGCFER
ncbi:MAG: hypothetical protein ACLR5T_06685 [Veillonella sp.]